MRVLYSPQFFPGQNIDYQFNGEEIIVKIDGISDNFDFTDVPNGTLEGVKTILPLNPIVSAKREGGVLSVELLNFIDDNATDDEKFPEWREING